MRQIMRTWWWALGIDPTASATLNLSTLARLAGVSVAQASRVMPGLVDLGLVERITKPTLVIHGENDPILPLPNGQVTAKHIEGARLRTLVEAGHEPNPSDLATIRDAITTFLSAVDAAHPPA